jgi:hypothetical protein
MDFLPSVVPVPMGRGPIRPFAHNIHHSGKSVCPGMLLQTGVELVIWGCAWHGVEMPLGMDEVDQAGVVMRRLVTSPT